MFAAPFMAFAQAQYSTAEGIGSVIGLISGIVGALIPLMMAAALLAFFWGLVQYIFKIGGGKTKGSSGRGLMIWSLVALFVMASVWGLVNLLRDSFGIDDNDQVHVPAIPSGTAPKSN